MEARRTTPLEDADRIQKKSLGLAQTDIDDLRQIQKHYGLDSLSQAARRAIRSAASVVAFEASRNGRTS